MDASAPSSASSSSSSSQLPSSSPPSSSVLSSLSPHSSSSLSKFSPCTPPPAQTLHHGNAPARKPFFPFVRKRKASSYTWVSRFLRPRSKPSMEADKGLLLHTTSEGDADARKADEKPKRELRFAAKIAAAMDADGFMGVKDSVCADDAPIGMKQSVCKKNVDTLYCSPSLAMSQRAPLKQTRLRRRWRICRRLRRTRVLFACMLQKIRKALAPSSKRTLQVHDGFAK